MSCCDLTSVVQKYFFKFFFIFLQLEEHGNEVRVLLQEQDHIMRLIDIAEKVVYRYFFLLLFTDIFISLASKVNMQDECIRKFCDQQQKFMREMMPSLEVQSVAMKALSMAQEVLFTDRSLVLGPPSCLFIPRSTVLLIPRSTIFLILV